MNIFFNIYNGWSTYEWIMVGGSILSVFLITNSLTYLLTRNVKFCIPLSLTYTISILLTIVTILIYTLFPSVGVSNISLISILISMSIITLNWFSFIGFYIKTKGSKKFSLMKIFKEYRGDSTRVILFTTLSVLSLSILLSGELLAMLISTVLVSSISIYLNTVLVRKFIHD